MPTANKFQTQLGCRGGCSVAASGSLQEIATPRRSIRLVSISFSAPKGFENCGDKWPTDPVAQTAPITRHGAALSAQARSGG